MTSKIDDYEDYKQYYDAQILTFAPPGSWFDATIDRIRNTLMFVWIAAKVVAIFLVIIAIILAIFWVYTFFKHYQCRNPFLLACLCPWFSLVSLRKRYDLLSCPGQMIWRNKVVDYEPDDVEMQMTEYLSELIQREIPIVGDGA